MNAHPLASPSADGSAAAAGQAPRWRMLLLWLLLPVPLALAIGVYAWQAQTAQALLDALAGTRAAVRGTYTSSAGYGPQGSAPRVNLPEQVAALRAAGWRDEGRGAVRFRDGTLLTVVSQVRTFQVDLAGVSPLACSLLIRSLDEGWREVLRDGRPMTPGAGCGWWGRSDLRLTSSG